MVITKKGGRTELIGSSRLGNLIDGVHADEAVTKRQLDAIETGSNDFTGTNTFLGLSTDTISEKTSDTGVTVDGVLLKDGQVAATALGNAASTGQILTVVTTLTATEIVGNAAGDLGHANGATIVTAPTSAYTIEFISAVLFYDFATAAYTGGGDDLVVCIGSGGATLSGAATSASLLGAAGDKIVMLTPLSTAGIALSVGTGLSLKSTAWTNPGTAAGQLRCHVSYRIHTSQF
jgi:hypothetical protein